MKALFFYIFSVLEHLIIANTFFTFAYVFALNKKGALDVKEKSTAFGKLLYGGIERNLVLNGEYWRLFTACFSHGSLSNIFFNMIFLAQIGSILEATIRQAKLMNICCFV